jgi:ribosomal protein S18 acetylase RimI-like enzyme
MPLPNTNTNPTITIRPRLPTDVPSCAALLARVYEKDHYPVQGVSHAVEFLSSPSTLASWVAVAETSAAAEDEETTPDDEIDPENQHHHNQPPKILAHISLSLPVPSSASSTDPAVALWHTLHPSHPPPIAVLERLFVDPSARRQGLAESLIRTVTAAAAEKGLRCVLFALVKDVGAMRLYGRVGWGEFGRRGFGYEDVEGEWREMEAVCFVGPETGAETGRG